MEKVNNPKLVLIVGCVGLALNLISALFLHEHDHDHDHGPTNLQDTEAISVDSIHASHLHVHIVLLLFV